VHTGEESERDGFIKMSLRCCSLNSTLRKVGREERLSIVSLGPKDGKKEVWYLYLPKRMHRIFTDVLKGLRGQSWISGARWNEKGTREGGKRGGGGGVFVEDTVERGAVDGS